MARILRTEFPAFSAEFSPFHPDRVAIGTSQYFGIVGNGKQEVATITPTGEFIRTHGFYSQQGVVDCAWSEENEFHIVSACGDGTIKLWDLVASAQDGFPLQNFAEHGQDASSVAWNPIAKDSFISGSWDTTIKLWRPEAPRSLMTFAGHVHSVFGVAWNVYQPTVFASCSGDKTVRVWDTREPTARATILAHEHEILTLDWNKYNEFVLATGAADCRVNIFDIRRPLQPMSSLRGHESAVRRVKWSPHEQFLLGTASYDMNIVLWNSAHENPLLQRFSHHTEFVCGFDFNLFIPGQVVSSSWDCHACVWNLLRGGRPPPIPPIAGAVRPPGSPENGAGAGPPRIPGAGNGGPRPPMAGLAGQGSPAPTKQ